MSSSVSSASRTPFRREPFQVPERKRGCLVELLLRFFHFIFQVVLVLFFTGLVLAIAGGGGYYFVQRFVQGKEVLVPNITGKKVDQAARLLLDLKTGLAVRIEGFEYSDLVGEGEIVQQFPRPGNRVKGGTVLRVQISKGTTLMPCPDMRARNYLEAGIGLRNANLAQGRVSYILSDEAKKDLVIAQDPPPGAIVERESPVNLLVSLGSQPARVTMPNLLDQTPVEADMLLRRLGLRIGRQREAAQPGRDSGIIFQQEPLPGSPVSPEDPITVTVVRNEGI